MDITKEKKGIGSSLEYSSEFSSKLRDLGPFYQAGIFLCSMIAVLHIILGLKFSPMNEKITAIETRLDKIEPRLNKLEDNQKEIIRILKELKKK